MFKKIIPSLFLVIFFLGQIILPINFAKASDIQDIVFDTTVTGNISATNTQNVYRIVLTNAGKININMNSELNSVRVDLEDSDGNSLMYQILWDGTEQSPKIWSQPVDLEAGTYYIKVSEYNFDIGNYSLDVDYTNANNNEVEPNDGNTTAQSLILNSDLINGYLTLNDDQDTYKIVLDKPGKINIDMNSELDGLYVELMDSNGKQVLYQYLYNGTEQSPKAWLQSVDLEAGTYYLNVTKYNDNTGKYTLKVDYTAANNNDVEPNNGNLTAQSLVLNSDPITGYLTWDDDQDTYKIVLDKPGKINIEMNSELDGVKVDLKDSNGNQVLYQYLYNGTEQSPKAWLQSVDFEAGTYYFNVTKYNSNTGKYTLKVEYTSADNNDVEPNSGNITAQSIILNSNQITGYLTWNDDQDTYKFVLEKAGKININMKSMLDSVRVDLEDPNGNNVLHQYVNDGTEQSPKTWLQSVDLEAGTYYLKVSKVYDDTGKYTLKVDYNAANNSDIEPNDGVLTAQSLILNSNPITGYLSWNDDQDVYKIVLSKVGKININMSSMLGSVNVDLEDQDGISELNLYVDGGTEQSPKPVSQSLYLRAGTYYLKVSKANSNTGKYTLKVARFNRVFFNTNGGTEVITEDVANNDKLVKPINPSKVGYTFGGWYKENTLVNLFDFEKTPITGDIILYAKWIANPVLPANLKAASAGYNSIKISWSLVSGVSGYQVFRATSSTGTYTLVGTTTSTSFDNSGLATNKSYYYKIRAYRTVGSTKVYSNFSAIVSAKPILTLPTSVKTASSSYNSIKTSWSAVSGANGYVVYRAASSTGSYTYVGTTTSISFNNTGLTTNRQYFYKIRAFRMIGSTRVYSNYSGTFSTKPIPSVPTNFKARRLSRTSIKLTWRSVSGASGYKIYRSISKSGTYSLLKSTTSKYYTNSRLTKGKTYYYKLRAYRTVGTKKVYSSLTSIIRVKP